MIDTREVKDRRWIKDISLHIQTNTQSHLPLNEVLRPMLYIPPLLNDMLRPMLYIPSFLIDPIA